MDLPNDPSELDDLDEAVVEPAALPEDENRNILDCMLRILGIYKEKEEITND